MSFRVVAGVVLAFVGGTLVSVVAQIDVRRSRNPKARRYALPMVILIGGLAAIIFFAPCAHLSAWAIGIGTFLFSIGISIASWSWGYVIPELMKVVAVLTGILAGEVIASILRPCN